MAERHLRTLFWYVFIASRGGPTRMRIVKELLREPLNANQLAELLGLDYSTVRRHLDILESNGLLTAQGSRYNVVYFPSQVLETNLDLLEGLERDLSQGFLMFRKSRG